MELNDLNLNDLKYMAIKMNLKGRAAEWKRANLPIGFIKFPK